MAVKLGAVFDSIMAAESSVVCISVRAELARLRSTATPTAAIRSGAATAKMIPMLALESAAKRRPVPDSRDLKALINVMCRARSVQDV